jgi:hypothetical protein
MVLGVRPVGRKSTPPPGGLPAESLRRLRTGLLSGSFWGLSGPQFPEELAPQLTRLLSELRSPLLHPLLSGLLGPLRSESLSS